MVRKAKRALEDGTLAEKTRRKIAAEIWTPLRVVASSLTAPRERVQADVEQGFADHRNDPRARNITADTAARIIEAYNRAKALEPQAHPAMQVRDLWAELRDINHRAWMDALRTRATDRVVDLLNNFEREDFARGTGAGHQDYWRFRHGRVFPHTNIRYVWEKYRQIVMSNAPRAGDALIRHPMIGNPAGVFLGESVIQVETWRHIFNALELAELLRDVPRAIIVEIGGGFGSQAHQTVRLASASVQKYVIFDIPEVAAVSGAFLISAFPDKRVRLFGEGPMTCDGAADYDIAVFPHFMLSQVEDLSADVVFNTNSFSEMGGDTAADYLRTINRICRRYFRHTNHDERLTYRSADGAESRNVIGSEMVPDPALFKRLYKRPRLFGRPEDTPYRSHGFLYERLRTQ